MNIQVVNEWASLAVSIAALASAGWAAAKVAYSRGADDQRQENLEARMTAVEGRVGKLEDAMARVPVIEEKLTGTRDMVMRDLDEVKHALRNLQMGASVRRRSAGGTA